LAWTRKGKEEEGKTTKDTHTALAHCFFQGVYYFSILFYTDLSFLAGWSNGAIGMRTNIDTPPPFFFFYRLSVVVVGWLVDTCTFLAYLLHQLLAFSNERSPLHSTSAK
jgi:hypothetical protein